MTGSKALAFTGHQPESLLFGENELSAVCIRLKALLLDEIMRRAEQGYDTFYCGAERGIDIIFGDHILLVKMLAHPQLRLIFVVPHKEQTNGWPEKWRKRYFDLLERADDMVLISSRYTHDCHRLCNHYMVDRSNALLAVHDGSESDETAYTVAYALRANKEVTCINPYTLERT